MTHKELIKIREEKHLTKGQFAALIGITAMMQGRYESGKVAIPAHIAERVLALSAAKAVKEAAQEKAKDAAKVATKAAAKDVAKVAAKKVTKDVEKKVVKDAAKAAVGAVAAKEVKKAVDNKKKAPVVYIESLMGGTITIDEILNRIPSGAKEVYVKPGENKAYWVKGKKTGDVDLWD
jgi:transcriptional regulator with XRE-family HTH domain